MRFDAEIAALCKRAAKSTEVGGGGQVVFYGSSSIRLWDTLAADFAPVPTLNLGFGGSTARECVEAFDAVFATIQFRSLVVYAGDNDVAEGSTPDAVLGAWRELADKIAARFGNVPLAYVAIKPSPSRFAFLDRVREANALIREDIRGRENGYFVDVFCPMLSGDGKPRPELFTEDMLHMNHDGYRIWTNELKAIPAIIPPIPAT